MTLYPHLATPGGYEALTGNPILDRLDGGARAPLQTILSPSWSNEERAAYGVVMLEPQTQPTSWLVDVERDRRINAGMNWNGVRFQTRSQDLDNLHGGATMALAAMAQGGGLPGDLYWHGGAEPFSWIAEDNSVHTFDAPGIFALARAAAVRKSAHIFAARAIKDMNPIPVDFADDQYWPA